MPPSKAESNRKLWVCWEAPRAPIPADAVVLSFASPEIEEDLAKGRPLERAREVSQSIKPGARRTYLELVARLGIADCGGTTFRRRLQKGASGSCWWYHPVAFRDCESDPTFDSIIAILTVDAVAERSSCRELVVVGAPAAIADVLSSRFRVTRVRTRGARKWGQLVKAVGRRVVEGARQCGHVLRRIPLPDRSVGVFFSALWDWSFDVANDGTVRDHYFRNLPDEIDRSDIGPSAWLVWIDSVKKRPAADLTRSSRLVCLQSFLRLSDVIKAHADLRPLICFLRWRGTILETLRRDDYDFRPLFSTLLLCGFADQSLPHAELVRTSTLRATTRYRPRAFVSFLEHFPHARSAYSAIAEAPGCTTFAMQHASYNRDKTFLSLHPDIEFRGKPDGSKVPTPDFLCAMGELGRELFLECGYPEERVLLTGSPRYDSIRDEKLHPASIRSGGPIGVLMVATLNVEMELEMMTAVAAASRGLAGLRLRLRCHPARAIREKDAASIGIQITTGPLEDNLADADLVIFTYSTVGEEAFIAGKPVWQWLPTGFDGSALAAVSSVPRFGSVSALRQAFIAFVKDRSRFAPDVEARRSVLKKLFFLGDGKAARRVADRVEILSLHKALAAPERRTEFAS
jgi:hypothetical protein